MTITIRAVHPDELDEVGALTEHGYRADGFLDRADGTDVEYGDELRDAFDRSDADGDVRAVVVTGSGRAFCAGADLAGGGGTFDHGGDEDDGPAAPESRRDGGGRLRGGRAGPVGLDPHRDRQGEQQAQGAQARAVGSDQTGRATGHGDLSTWMTIGSSEAATETSATVTEPAPSCQ